MNPAHEYLASGIAHVADEADDTDVPEVRIVPVPEGTVTVGQSGKKTVWDREPLREAVEAGALDGATIVKGEGGENPHFAMDEQVPPDNILGRVDEWDYEDDVGPVGHAQLADEGIARRIDLGLLEVSADMKRVLGDFDDEREAHPVEQLVSMPRITVLEHGAAKDATIEPATAEALGVHPDHLGVGAGIDAEQLAGLQTLKFQAYGDMIGQEFVDAAVSSVNAIAGLSAVASETSDSPELLVVIDHEAVESLDSLNDQIISALEDTPFEVFEDWDWVEELRYEHLAGSGGDDDTSPSEAPDDDVDGEQAGADPAEPGRDSTTHMDPNDKIEDLQEQLAEVKQEKRTLEEEKEDLEEQTEDLESKVEEKEEAIEDREERISDLKEDTEHARRRLALEATGGNESAAEMLVDSEKSMDELATSAAEANDYDLDEDSDKSPVEQVEEQLAVSPAHRGQNPDPGEGGQLTEEQLAEANGRATGVMTMQDVQAQQTEQLSPRDYVKREHGVDPAEYETEQALRSAVAASGGDDE